MLDSKFRKEEFCDLAHDPKKVKELILNLQEEVAKRLHGVVAPEMKRCVKELMDLGHKLGLYTGEEIGELCYRDDEGVGDSYCCHLRIAFDFTVSVGFRDVSDLEFDDIDLPLE